MTDRNPNYDSLGRILDEAYAQAAFGKGAERHANAKPFDAQPMLEIGRMLGPAAPLFQVMKKAQEAGSFVEKSRAARRDNETLRLESGSTYIEELEVKYATAAKAELLGAINYCAGAILLVEEILAKANAKLNKAKSHVDWEKKMRADANDRHVYVEQLAKARAVLKEDSGV